MSDASVYAVIDPNHPRARLRQLVPADWRRPDMRADWRIIWRDDLDYGQIMPRPAPELIPAFYRVDDYYTHGGGGGPKPEGGRALFERALLHLAWRADRGVEPDAAWWRAALGASPRRVLEIGCGHGANLSRLAELGHQVEGVEPDPAAVAEARAMGLTVGEGTAEAPPQAVLGQHYDAVVMMHVLEHCLDPTLALRNARALMSEGGVLVVETPNNACRGAALLGAAWHWLDAPRHLNFFTARSLGALLGATGFAPIATVHRGYARQFSPEWIDVQRRIAALFGAGRSQLAERALYLRLLAATLFAEPGRKYDSVRITARPT